MNFDNNYWTFFVWNCHSSFENFDYSDYVDNSEHFQIGSKAFVDDNSWYFDFESNGNSLENSYEFVVEKNIDYWMNFLELVNWIDWDYNLNKK